MAQQASQRVTIRAYQPEDFDALTRIIEGIWWTGAPTGGASDTTEAEITTEAENTDNRQKADNQREDIRKETRRGEGTALSSMLARLDMLHSLGKSTDAVVAADGNGQVLGTIFLRIASHGQRWWRECEAAAAPVLADVAAMPGCERMPQALQDDKHAIDTLSDRAAAGYPAEVVLFILAPQARGLGIGRRLFDTGLDLMRRAGAGRYFLYTDTASDYGFYEHRGLRRIGEELGSHDTFGEPLDRFIYADTLAREDASTREDALVWEGALAREDSRAHAQASTRTDAPSRMDATVGEEAAQ